MIAPSRSLAVVAPTLVDRAVRRLEARGCTVSFGERVSAAGLFDTADPADRVQDLHDAYADDSVDLVMSVIGGTRCADVLPHVDWDLIRRNPKPLCGFSDITALLNAVWARSGVPCLLGPHFSSFAMDEPDDYQTDGFVAALTNGPRALHSSSWWSDSEWFRPDVRPHHRANPGPRVLRAGAASGIAVGGNLSTFRNLLGTRFAPSLDGAVLLVEDTGDVTAKELRRGLAAVSMAEGFTGLSALLIGRFCDASGMSPQLLDDVIASLPAYSHVPCVADLDFGHTQPIATVPIGRRLDIAAVPGAPSVEVSAVQVSSSPT